MAVMIENPSAGRLLKRKESGSDLSPELSIVEHTNNTFSEAELQEHFARFKAYDLDDLGFISADNLKSILSVLEVDVTDQQITQMIHEVAVISGHANSGRLSFEDYLRCMEFERAQDAAAEPKLEEGGSTPDPEAEQPAQQEPSVPEKAGRARRSSFAALDMVARGRIGNFEKMIQQSSKTQNMADAQVRSQARFAAKLAKFERPAAGMTESAVEQEKLHKQSVKDKLSAFESINAAVTPQATHRKTWKKVANANMWVRKTQTAGAPPPKRSVMELP